MKTAILIGVLSLCGLVFLLAITGVTGWIFAPSPSSDDTDDKMPVHMVIRRILYPIYHPGIENKVVFIAEVSSGTEETPTAEEERAGIERKFHLADLLLRPGKVGPEEPAVCIKAGEANLFQHARKVGKENAPYFRAYMTDGVSVEARQRTSLVVSSNEMSYWQDLKEIHADGRVTIRDLDSRLFHLTGTGMNGMLDFRNVVIHDSPVAYLVSGAFGQDKASGGDSPDMSGVTRITCEGPATVRRFERPHYIRSFLVEIETLKSFGQDDATIVKFLAALRIRMLEEDIKQEDYAGTLKAAGEVVDELAIPSGRKLLEGDAGKTLVRALSFMRYVSPALDMNDLAFLRELEKKIDDKDLGSVTGGGTASLTIITFEKNVVTATRSNTSDLAALARKPGIARDFAPPFVDSVQKCDRMVIYCREETAAGEASAAGIEPVKIELHGGEHAVIMKSYEPRKALRKKLALFQKARYAAVYTKRRTYTDSSGKQKTRFVQKRLVLDGDVYIQRMEKPGKEEGTSPATNTVYEAWGHRLEWERDTGGGRLSGAPGVRPSLTYSKAPVFAPVSSNGDRRGSAFTIMASAADAVTFLQANDEGPIKVRLLKDVRIEKSESAAGGEKQRDVLTAADWVELVFHRKAVGREETGSVQSIFTNFDRLRALGRVNMKTADGEAWGDYLVHEKRILEGREVEMTILYKITGQNRESLLGDSAFAGGNWPLRAVMSSSGSSDFLGTLPEQDSPGEKLQTYTTACDGEIQYIHYPEDAPLAGRTIFLKNVKIKRSESGSRFDTTLEAAERVELEFTRIQPSGGKAGKPAVEVSRLFAKHRVHLSEPVEKRGVSKMQEAAADTLTWRHLPANDEGGRAADRVILEGTGTTAPEVRFTVTQRVEKKKNGRVVDTVTEEEQTTIICSPDGGRITVYRLRNPKRNDRPEDNYVIAEKEAHVRRTGARINSAGLRKEDAPWDVRAGKMTTYYIPSMEKGMSARVKKIIAEDNVVASSSQMTATGARGVWERIYGADIVERTTLYAARGGTARIRLLSKDSRDRPADTKMQCADKIVITRTIYDELASPKVAAKTSAMLINTVRVDHLGYSDRSDKLNQDITLTCDRLDIGFADTLRDKHKSGGSGRMDVERMTATGNARYQVFQLLKKEHKYPGEMVLRSEGIGGYFEYNKPGAGAMVGRMQGRKNERGEYIEEAERFVYRYDKDTRKKIGEMREHGNELPPARNWKELMKGND